MPGPVDAPRPTPSALPLAAAADGVDVLLSRLDPDLPVPGRARPGDAGVDLRCTTDVVLEPGERALVGTGVAVALPEGWAGFVHPRSGLAARAGLSIVNAPGTVDAGYRGEIRVCLINHDPREAVRLRRGDRIAQLIVQRVAQVRFVEVDELPDSERGAGGHGSTGGHDRLLPESVTAFSVGLPPGDRAPADHPSATPLPGERPSAGPDRDETLPDGPVPGDPMSGGMVPGDLRRAGPDGAP